jgi:hypothetical protein
MVALTPDEHRTSQDDALRMARTAAISSSFTRWPIPG